MKIAICLSGHLRKFVETYPSLKQSLLNKYDCDIFIHTWDKMGYSCDYKQDVTLNETSHYESQIKSIYNPKKLIIEDSSFIETLKNEGNRYAPHLISCPKHVGHMASMFYKIYAANEIRKLYEMENGIKYDMIVRCRPDLVFRQEISLPTQLRQYQVLIPKMYSGIGWYCDQFAAALPETMDLYSAFFFNLEEYFSARNEYYPEKFMDWSCRKVNLLPEFHDFDFFILR